MAIVTMKHLRLIGLLSDQAALFEQLQHMGTVEIRQHEVNDPAWDGLVRPGSSTRSEKELMLEETAAAIKTLDTYAPQESSFLSPRPQVTEEKLFDQRAIAEAVLKVRRINDYAAELQTAAADVQRLEATCGSLLPWTNLDIPLNTESTDSCRIAFGMLPASVDLDAVRTELQTAAEASQLYEIGRAHV